MARNISEFVNDMKYVTTADLGQQYVKKGGDIVTGDYNITGSVTVSGTVNAGQFAGLSDLKKKSDLAVIENALAKIATLQGFTYNLEGMEGRKAGLIAQDVEEVLPESVVENDGVKSIDYNGVIALLVQAVNEMQQKIEKLER